MSTPEQDEQRAAQLEAEALALRTKAQEAREQQQPISSRTKLPVEHPESQEVERIHYERQTSSASRPEKEKENETKTD
jgi:hypothetical protein